MNKASVLVTGVLIGAAVTTAVGISAVPSAERKMRHVRRNMCRAAHVMGDAMDSIGHMNW